MMADADTGEFWGLFGGFAPLPRKISSKDNNESNSQGIIVISPPKLFWYRTSGQLYMDLDS